ncbi:potassium ion transporter [Pelomyxa schiedti]|nr:potassium ion transporter [Pelomyxa schiedti]
MTLGVSFGVAGVIGVCAYWARGKRSWVQVISTGGAGTVCCFIYLCRGVINRIFGIEISVCCLSAGFLACYCCCAADTWSSEVGMLSPSPPVLITRFTKVPQGTNGGISTLGTLSAPVGGFLMGVTFWGAQYISSGPTLFPMSICSALTFGSVVGLLGSLVDSLMGATLQYSGWDSSCNKVVNGPGPKVKHISGMDIFSNTQVNLITTCISTIVAFLVAPLSMSSGTRPALRESAVTTRFAPAAAPAEGNEQGADDYYEGDDEDERGHKQGWSEDEGLTSGLSTSSSSSRSPSPRRATRVANNSNNTSSSDKTAATAATTTTTTTTTKNATTEQEGGDSSGVDEEVLESGGFAMDPTLQGTEFAIVDVCGGTKPQIEAPAHPDSQNRAHNAAKNQQDIQPEAGGWRARTPDSDVTWRVGSGTVVPLSGAAADVDSRTVSPAGGTGEAPGDDGDVSQRAHSFRLSDSHPEVVERAIRRSRSIEVDGRWVDGTEPDEGEFHSYHKHHTRHGHHHRHDDHSRHKRERTSDDGEEGIIHRESDSPIIKRREQHDNRPVEAIEALAHAKKEGKSSSVHIPLLLLKKAGSAPRSARRKLAAALLNRHSFHYAPIHFVWFTFLSLVGAAVCYSIERLWNSDTANSSASSLSNFSGISSSASSPHPALKFIDSWFMCVSAISATGLSSVDLSEWYSGSKIVLLLLMLVGGAVMDSTVPLLLSNSPSDTQHGEVQKAPPRTNPEVESALRTERAVTALYSRRYKELGDFSAKTMLGVIHFYFTGKPNSAITQPWFFAAFHAVAAFNNAGLSLLRDNCVPLALDTFPLFVTMFLILLGNTGYPVGLYFTVRTISWIKPNSKLGSTLRDVLKNPRKYLTVLFPWKYTLYILLIVMGTTLAQFAILTGLDWQTLSYLSPGHRIVNCMFQCVSTRTAGFNSIDVSALDPGVHVMLITMMYIAALPIAVSLRDTNVLINMWSHSDSSPKANRVLHQFKRLLLFDITWVIGPWFIICCIEAENIQTDPVYTPFKILFEIVSSYGTVGLTLGVAGKPYSFSGCLSPASKIFMIMVMLVGRHRGFPDKLDVAIQPSHYFLNRPYEVKARKEKDEPL